MSFSDSGQEIGAHHSDAGQAALRLPAGHQVTGKAGIVGDQDNMGIAHPASTHTATFSHSAINDCSRLAVAARFTAASIFLASFAASTWTFISSTCARAIPRAAAIS